MTFPFMPGLIRKPVPTLIGLNVAANAAADASLSLAATSHQPGDYIIALTGNRTITPPALLTNFTSLAAQGAAIASGSRSFRVQYLVATGNSLTINYVGSYAHIWVIRGARKIGSYNSYRADTAGAVLPLPDLTNLSSSESVVIASSYGAGLTTATTSPYELVGTSATAVIVQNTRGSNSSLLSKTITTTVPGGTAGTLHLTYAIELI